MKRIVFAFITSVVLMSGASASEVAFCTPGFNIQTVPGDKAICAKTEVVWQSVGNRKCLLDGRRTSHEADDVGQGAGGDMCAGTGGLLVGPAVLCEISFGPGHRTRMVRGGPDQCEKKTTVTSRGNVLTRNE